MHMYSCMQLLHMYNVHEIKHNIGWYSGSIMYMYATRHKPSQFVEHSDVGIHVELIVGIRRVMNTGPVGGVRSGVL